MDFRDACPADAPLIAAIHVASWRVAYAHIMDPAWLADGIEAERLATWTQRLESPAPGQRVIIAERDGEAVGFTCVIGGSDPVWGTLVDNLHALPSAKGGGIGTALLDQAARWALAGWPDAGLFLWCYSDNVAARGFYAARGGVEVEDWNKPGPDGRTLPEKRIAWADPGVLTSPPVNGRGSET
ncbi:Ribosomal protein S18 acetylase RimI [Sphingobium sp. AP50]|uniref:GNAT family N-acetyltransferase n=1 Tax=Sphingobium sp. AP50 TaxID=1884369 RepID=UPI0008B503EE|nr:GNAT family N-acetyltransferase [Sphingobium sp. AP50]SEJ77843.1 Ribosomal protein S18 acetylase RimI [Sphingobium sp. AP50]